MFLTVLFFLSATLTIASGIMVVVVRNLMHSCMALLGCFIGVAGLYVTLGANFIAAVQFMVYVGGVIILMLFAIMLTGNKPEEKVGSFLLPAMGNRRTLTWGLITALVFFLSVGKILLGMFGIGLGKKTAPTDPSLFESTVDEIGTLLLTDHVLAFEMSSVLLLGALIGAAIIARPETSKEK
ncbi:MAG: NADH-quinone oxidoreductase subunit J [Bacteriovoracales bacterium]|nr:NADH-quinone oxidoreductase subunit J [Bacteriovoracales bacterium]